MSSERLTTVIDWLRSKKPQLVDVPLDVDLVQSGILDSLQFMNFLLMLEEVRGAPIPPDDVVPENFADLRTIERLFLSAPSANPQSAPEMPALAAGGA